MKIEQQQVLLSTQHSPSHEPEVIVTVYFIVSQETAPHVLEVDESLWVNQYVVPTLVNSSMMNDPIVKVSYLIFVIHLRYRCVFRIWLPKIP